MTTDTTSGHAQGASRALRAVLEHPDVARAVDERFLESLLCRALSAIPGFGEALFGRGELEYEFGRRGQADLVGRSHDLVEVQCEIKVHSKLNWLKSERWQLDEYAQHAPTSAGLFLLTARRRHAALAAELEDKRVGSRARWSVLHLDEARGALDEIGAPQAEPGGMIETLACSLARLAVH